MAVTNDKVNKFFISKVRRVIVKKDISMFQLINGRKRTIKMSDGEFSLPRKLIHEKNGIIIQAVNHDTNNNANPSNAVYFEDGEDNIIENKNSKTNIKNTSLYERRALVRPLFVTTPGNHSKFL